MGGSTAFALLDTPILRAHPYYDSSLAVTATLTVPHIENLPRPSLNPNSSVKSFE